MKILQRLLSYILSVALLLSVLPKSRAENDPFPCAAKLAAGTVLYSDRNLSEVIGTLDKDVIVTLTEQVHESVCVRYKIGLTVCYAWIRQKDAAILAFATPTDLLPFSPVEPEETVQEPVPDEENGESVDSEAAEQETVPDEENGEPADSEAAEQETVPDEENGEPADSEAAEQETVPDEENGEPADTEAAEQEPVPDEEDGELTDTETAEQEPVPDEEDGEPADTEAAEQETVPEGPDFESAAGEVSDQVAIPDEAENRDVEQPERDPAVDDFSGFGFGSREEIGATPPEELPESALEEEALSASGPAYVMSEDGTFVTASYRNSEEETTDLPEVRTQGEDGVCWAYAAIGAMEIALIKAGQAIATGLSAINLSEFFVAYYAAHNYPYPKGGDEGDTVSPFISDELAAAGYTYLDIGGNSRMAYTILSSVIGTTNEGENSNEYPVEDAADAVPDSYEIAAQITGAYYLNMDERNQIQEEIRKHGSVKVSVCMPSSSHPEWPVYYNAETAALYGTNEKTNHDVLLVGWNDDYPRENFSSSLRPASNGAWKARNSWGSSWGQNGYFWISYEDRSIRNPVAFEAENSDISDYVYSYTKVPNPYTYYRATAAEADIVQSFTVDPGEKLHAIGVETMGDGYRLSAAVRVNGTVVATSSTQSAPYRGFYLLKLSPAYAMNSRTTVEVTVTYTTTNGSNVSVPYQYPGEYTPAEGAQLDYYYTSGMGSDGFTVNGSYVHGDSMIKLYTQQNNSAGLLKKIALNETEITINTADTVELEVVSWEPDDATNKSVRWYSSDTMVAYIADDTNGRVVGGEKSGTATITAMSSNGVYATCTVHVVAKDVKIKGISIPGYTQAYRIDETTIPGASLGEQLILNAELNPKYAPSDDLKWSTSNDSVLSIERIDDKNKQCTLEFRKNGFATITVESVKSGAKYWIDFTVYLPIHVSSVELDYSSLALWEGESWQLSAVVYPTEASDQRIIWSSSDPAVATVSENGFVTGLRDGTAYITAASADGNKAASCHIVVSARDPVEAFVNRMYRVCLLREPDEGGKALWIDQLKTRKKTGAEVAYQFYNSAEMIGRNLSDADFVERCYEGLMDRGSDPDGKANWIKKLEYGMSRKVVISGFVRSNEFRNICNAYQINQGQYISDEYRDQNMGVTGFVSRLYTKMLNRIYDVNGLNHWCKKILDNPTKQNLLTVALNGFLHSKEFTEKNLNNEAFVKVLYRTFLDREAEPGGLAHWTGKLESGMTRDQVAEGFAISAEFSNIMKAYGF